MATDMVVRRSLPGADFPSGQASARTHTVAVASPKINTSAVPAYWLPTSTARTSDTLVSSTRVQADRMLARMIPGSQSVLGTE